MRRLYEYIKPYWQRISVAMAVKLTATVSELMLPWLLQTIIDDVVPDEDIRLVTLWGGAMIFCSLICVLGNIIANRKAAAVSRDVTRTLRHDLFSRISYLSSAQIDKLTVPSLISRLTTDSYNVHQMVGMVQRMGVRAPILLMGGIIVTLMQDVTLALILIATMPLIGVSVAMVSKTGIPLFGKLQKSIDGLVRVVRENVSGARVIKALSKSEYEVDRFSRQSKQVADDDVRANTIMSLSSPFVTIFLNLGLVVVLIVGAYRVRDELTKPGVIVAFLSYFALIANGMLGLTRIFVVISRASASANRIEEVLALPEDLITEPISEPVSAERAQAPSEYHIEFNDVVFSYNKRKPTLQNISFRLKRGDSLGIIGATGSGKSTILLLLMRFYDVDSGEIIINGQNVKHIPPDVLHTMFGITFQNDVVYSDTVYNNITLGRDISDEAVSAAIMDAQATYIHELESALETPLNAKGTNISGGQRQRLLIARALAGEPEILMLDDASSALDYRTDADLRLALKRRAHSATSIFIASRVSSIAHCTQILVMDEGRVIGQGTHEDLIKSCAAYRQIAETQMGGVS